MSPARHWPDPVVAPELEPLIERDDAPVLVTIEYRIAAASVPAFLHALRELSQERLRDGAWQWGVYHDAGRPECFIETFVLPSWREHERQHQRVSRADADVQAQVRALHIGAEPPRARHYIARWGARRTSGLSH